MVPGTSLSDLTPDSRPRPTGGCDVGFGRPMKSGHGAPLIGRAVRPTCRWRVGALDCPVGHLIKVFCLDPGRTLLTRQPDDVSGGDSPPGAVRTALSNRLFRRQFIPVRSRLRCTCSGQIWSSLGTDRTSKCRVIPGRWQRPEGRRLRGAAVHCVGKCGGRRWAVHPVWMTGCGCTECLTLSLSRAYE